ncbi:unnamed protein product [Prunus armeniaca]|uniref:Uncharacterized protein n=1 Tax=Prunus armeniaca TaxID=36596 RepID=A0A6J5TQH1_PRUAR|nr:unnamed protein product [Prunus armeniaca]CAB4295329.1 unnamed protein product [Prunus armeniaca]
MKNVQNLWMRRQLGPIIADLDFKFSENCCELELEYEFGFRFRLLELEFPLVESWSSAMALACVSQV